MKRLCCTPLPHLTPRFDFGRWFSLNSEHCELWAPQHQSWDDHRMLSQPSFSAPFPTVSDVTQLPSPNPILNI